MRNLVIATLFVVASGTIAGAQPRKPAAVTTPEVSEATQQTTRIKTGNVTFSQYRFVIIWKDATPPTTGFFYRSGNEWKESSLARPERKKFSDNPGDYMMVERRVEPMECHRAQSDPSSCCLRSYRAHPDQRGFLPAVGCRQRY